MGVESEYAVATPGKAFSAPGPYCMQKTASVFPFFTRAQPSAMPTPTRSWRHSTGRMSALAAASISDVVGYGAQELGALDLENAGDGIDDSHAWRSFSLSAPRGRPGSVVWSSPGIPRTADTPPRRASTVAPARPRR